MDKLGKISANLYCFHSADESPSAQASAMEEQLLSRLRLLRRNETARKLKRIKKAAN